MADGIQTPGPPRRVSRDREHPLSPAQASLWFLEQLDPGTPAYLIPLVLQLRGELDPGRVRETLALLVQRHEALRTRFGDSQGLPWQRVSEPYEPELPQEDIPPGNSAAGEDGPLPQALRRETCRPLDLEGGRLLRARLFRSGPANHCLALTLHHLTADGWSAGVLAGDFARIYSALGGSGAPLPAPLPLQHLDWVAWQRDRMEKGRLELLRRFWADHLREAPPVVPFRTDFPRPSVFGYRGSRFGRALSPALTGALREFARRERVTLSVVLAAVYAALLHQGSGALDLVTGFPYANRELREWEPVAGFFVNMALRRSDLSGDPSLLELVRRHRAEAWETIDWLDMPFEGLVESLCPRRDLSRQPLFQHTFSMQNLPASGPMEAGPEVRVLLADNGTCKFDLMLFASETADRLALGLQYCTDLFRPSTAARILAHCEELLGAVVREPGRRLSALPPYLG